MAEIDQIRLLLKELGPTLELRGIREESDGTSWGLATQDGTVFYLDFMADQDRLWLSARVGTAKPEDRAELYPLLLQYNAQWQQTGGVRLALEGPDDAVTLAYDLPASGLDLPRLCTVVGNFQDMIAGWRKVVEGTAEGNTAAPRAPGAIIRG